MTGLAPKSYGVGINPNCASMQRIQYMGEANVLMMPMAEALQHLVIPTGESLKDSQSMQKFLEDLSQVKLLAAKAKGLTLRQGKVKPLSVLFVPMGWVVLERVINGQVIQHLRCSCFYGTPASCSNAQACLQFIEPAEMRGKLTDIVQMCKPGES